MKINWTVAIITGIVGMLLFTAGASAQSTNEIETMIKLYLDAIKKRFGAPTQRQAETIAQIVTSFMLNGDRDFKKLAYILATAYHESKLRPIVEIRDRPGTDLYKLQERYWSSGYYGRGYVQLTWKDNYDRLGKRIGVDLLNNPDLALDPRYAADILVIGMMEGLFAPKAGPLNNYINNVADYYNARQVVNKLDKAQLIADYTTDIIKNLEYPIA
jgi:hypothetical protein